MNASACAKFNFHQGWEIGGPSALLAEWWVREHWGRAFEILQFGHPDDGSITDFVVMSRRDTAVSVEELEAVDQQDARESASLAYDVELLERQQLELGERMNAAERERLAERQRLADELARQQAETDRLKGSLNVITSSRHWQLTTPLRRLAASVRSLR